MEAFGDEAKILAGGQSLVPLLNMRLARPAHLIDINGCDELAYVREADGYLAIGAMTRQREVEMSPLAREACPLLAEALHWVGYLQTRYRGTIGGSVAHADPSAEIPTALTCLGGTMKVSSARGERVCGVEEFFVSYLTTSLQPDELLTEVLVPKSDPRGGWAFLELSRRHSDFALVGVACTLSLGGSNGKVTAARINLAGVGPVPFRPQRAVSCLLDQKPSDLLFREAGRIASEEVEPESDYHASAEYRREMVGILVRRGLEKALQRAEERLTDGTG